MKIAPDWINKSSIIAKYIYGYYPIPLSHMSDNTIILSHRTIKTNGLYSLFRNNTLDSFISSQGIDPDTLRKKKKKKKRIK